AGDFLLDQVISYFNQFTFPTIRDTTALKLAVLGNDAGVIGAGSLAQRFI
ncbi:ROK family glucokinase, partial [Lactobacillus delbrueckii subsp. bulgaricus]